MNKINVSLIIPTYNDQETILREILECETNLKTLTYSYEILVNDDKSNDNTWEVLSKNFKGKKKYTISQNKKNLGITKNIFNLYKKAKYDFILLYSADGDWNPKDIGKLIRTQIKENSDIVIGKRNKKIGYSYYRLFISFMHRLLPLLFFGVDTKDPGGIKILRKELVHIPLISKSQFFEAEIIIRAKKKGYKVEFCPVSYKKPKTGAGYGGDFKSAVRSFFDLINLRIKI